MTPGPTVDGVLLEWGELLFHSKGRVVKTSTPRLNFQTQHTAGAIRRRIVATVRSRAPQVMVKVTGGGRGMAAIAAHFRYISKNGRLPMEDDRGVVRDGKEAIGELAEQWRHGGSLIPTEGYRREAFNIMLSMPHGTDPEIVRKAAREFAQTELAGHRYVMVLHEHQENPHVHLSVKAESMRGERLNPRKTDLHRWRETFAEKLRGWGIEAEATRQAMRFANRHSEPLWRVKAKDEGRLREERAGTKSGKKYVLNRARALEAWINIMRALNGSERPEDRKLAVDIWRFVQESPFGQERARLAQRDRPAVDRQRTGPELQRGPSRSRPGPEMER